MHDGRANSYHRRTWGFAESTPGRAIHRAVVARITSLVPGEYLSDIVATLHDLATFIDDLADDLERGTMISINSFEIAVTATTAGPDVETHGTVIVYTNAPNYLRIGGSQVEADAPYALSLDQMPFVSGSWYPFTVNNLNELWFRNLAPEAVRVWYYISPVYVMGGS